MPSVTTVLGKVSITPKGDWSLSLNYDPLDVVNYGGNGYIAVQASIDKAPTSNPDYWMRVVDRGENGSLGKNSVAGVLKTTDWKQQGNRYYCRFNVSGMSDKDLPFATPKYSSSLEEDYKTWSQLFSYVESFSGYVLFYAKEPLDKNIEFFLYY